MPSRLYELAARPNLNWSHSFAAQPEIQTYLQRVADEPGLAQHFQYSRTVTRVAFNAAEGVWKMEFEDHAPVRARALVLALGPLNRPHMPDVPGIGTFRGDQVHSARWDRELTFIGRRVAVVGTGASAIQIVPEIAKHAEHLYVIQRSPAWILPRGERRFSRAKLSLFRNIPALHRLGRTFQYWKHEFFGNAYQREGLAYWLLTAIANLKRRLEVRDQELRARLTPADRIGCKRAMLSDDYLPSFAQANVTLLDSALAELYDDGVICTDGRQAEVDAIIYATGFHVTDPVGLLPVINADGLELAKLWQREGPQAYKSTVVAGFPNLLYLLGPNGGLGHSSAVHFVESQLQFVLAYLDRLDTLPVPSALNLPRERQDHYNDWIQAELAQTVWGTACNSWYVDHAGINRAIFPGLCQDYRRHMAKFDPSEFELDHT